MFQINSYSQLKSEIKEISLDFIQSPKFDVSGAKSKPVKPKDWLEIEVPLKLKIETRKPPIFIKNLKLKYYVLLDTKKPELMLTGSIDYVYIPLKGDVFASAYVSPSSLSLLLNDESPAKSDIRAVAVEVYHEGTIIGGKASKKESSKWWRNPKYTTLSGHIRSKNETPFAPLWWDRYVEVKKSKND